MNVTFENSEHLLLSAHLYIVISGFRPGGGSIYSQALMRRKISTKMLHLYLICLSDGLNSLHVSGWTGYRPVRPSTFLRLWLGRGWVSGALLQCYNVPLFREARCPLPLPTHHTKQKLL